ncbi:helix-turn-helix domain-containing protein [Limosilactobacillus reuteri]|uniref:helix-turn-helix domain-containing protein n=1 Tax=Limosilactobacillus reuteri TaxID=1598 RepID=UPI001E361217|nr:helix-turn-helix domain-containing protein [Limosilactobacillus reuteri]MCC4340085.1 helix-turn-helix domain-containing protein [Limosilactobacillus reuteri]MCC4349789.1 helix-turn-helix domain-containing protein [Limosilactobacillus reuteri]MCC4360907.1 helix-turn-helix domain-containing protein [Limosilactobacillus reuteri]MCC4379238.1 helix-turn-helix domain-containing protein [Limosilactobacillus reuteri]MCC4406592.1 helix-turn-helix domain-containing protein [Limosilactobacillus reuter
MEALKVELPDNVADAIKKAVNDAFAEAKRKAYGSNFPLYMNKKTACDYLGISNKTMNDWINAELVPFKKVNKVYRFNRNDLDKFMATK